MCLSKDLWVCVGDQVHSVVIKSMDPGAGPSITTAYQLWGSVSFLNFSASVLCLGKMEILPTSTYMVGLG